MNFQSILFKSTPPDAFPSEDPPDFLGDLNLDQIIADVAAARSVYDLAVFFRTPVPDIQTIDYRHEIFRDLEDETRHGHIAAFAKTMRQMHDYLAEAEASRHTYASQRWFLDAAGRYCDAVTTLGRDLKASAPKSEGLRAFQAFLSDYAASQAFAALVDDTRQRQAELAEIHYCVLIKGGRVTVNRYEDEPDYSAEIIATFERFKHRSTGDHKQEASESARLNQVEMRILECVAGLYPDVFARLESYCTRHHDYADDTVLRFEREIQFYMAYRQYIARIERAGHHFCYPRVSDQDRTIGVDDGFDLALAGKLIAQQEPIVVNDFYLEDPERIIVVSGPNQGGKTTFARMFGQLHYLARLGCPVPARQANLRFYDRLFTHFERAENIQNLRGKLEDDLVRIHHILTQATSRSLIVMNEIFSSTTSRDALFLGDKVLRQLSEKQALAVCVTFIDELASLNAHTISMVSTVEPDNPAIRTFRVVRKPADGLAYAKALAEKYRLTRQALQERL